MQRLVQLLLCSYLLWALLLNAVQAAGEDEDYEPEGTSIPDYDYNASFPFTFSFFSNVSSVYEDIHRYIGGGVDEDVTEVETQEVPRGTADSDHRAACFGLLLAMGHLLHQLFGPM